MSLILPYATVDVFTSTPLTGNQLGIVLLGPTQSLTQDLKLQIAKEFNYSETIFIHPFSPSTSSRRVDIFTPVSELPFAGHPTVGAVGYILSHLSPEKDSETNECLLDLKAGQVRGKINRETGFASAEIPHDVRIHGARLGVERVLASQPGLASIPAGINASVREAKHALVSIVNGMNFALVDLSPQPELLRQVAVSNSYVGTSADLDPGWRDSLIGSLFFVRRPDRGDGVVRVEQRVVVIGLEDPATGSASCALCAWMAVEGGGEGKTYRFELEQGTQMGRESHIGCEVTLGEDGAGVRKIVLSGQSRLVMNGEMYL